MFLEPQECHLGEHLRSCFPAHVVSLALMNSYKNPLNDNNNKERHSVTLLGGGTSIPNGWSWGGLYPRWSAVFREMEIAQRSLRS